MKEAKEITLVQLDALMSTIWDALPARNVCIRISTISNKPGETLQLEIALYSTGGMAPETALRFAKRLRDMALFAGGINIRGYVITDKEQAQEEWEKEYDEKKKELCRMCADGSLFDPYEIINWIEGK